MGPAIMHFERRMCMVKRDLAGGTTLRQGEPQMVAGIYTYTNETVHKSNFALMGQAVPLGALTCL
jgi:hypothetical protein